MKILRSTTFLLLLISMMLAPTLSNKCAEINHRYESLSSLLSSCGWNQVVNWIIQSRKAMVLKINQKLQITSKHVNLKNGANLDSERNKYKEINRTIKQIYLNMKHYLDLMHEWNITRKIFTARLLVTVFGPNCRPFLTLPSQLTTNYLKAYMQEAGIQFSGLDSYGILCPDALYFVRAISEDDLLRPLKTKIHKLPLDRDPEFKQYVDLHMKMVRRLKLKESNSMDLETPELKFGTEEISAMASENSRASLKDHKDSLNQFFEDAQGEEYFRQLIKEEDKDLDKLGGVLDTDDPEIQQQNEAQAINAPLPKAIEATIAEPLKVDLLNDVEIFQNEEESLLRTKYTLKKFMQQNEGFVKKNEKRPFTLKDRLIWERNIIHSRMDVDQRKKIHELMEIDYNESAESEEMDPNSLQIDDLAIDPIENAENEDVSTPETYNKDLLKLSLKILQKAVKTNRSPITDFQPVKIDSSVIINPSPGSNFGQQSPVSDSPKSHSATQSATESPHQTSEDTNQDDSDSDSVNPDESYKKYRAFIKHKSSFDKGYFLEPIKEDELKSLNISELDYETFFKNLLKMKLKVSYMNRKKNEAAGDFEQVKFRHVFKINPHIKTDFWTRLHMEAEIAEKQNIESNMMDFITFEEFEYHDFAKKRDEDADLARILEKNAELVQGAERGQLKKEKIDVSQIENVFYVQQEKEKQNQAIGEKRMDLSFGAINSMGNWDALEKQIGKVRRKIEDMRKDWIIYKKIDKENENPKIPEFPNEVLTNVFYKDEYTKINDLYQNHHKWDYKNRIGAQEAYANLPDLAAPAYERERRDPAMISEEIGYNNVSQAGDYEDFDIDKKIHRLIKPPKMQIRIKRDLEADIKALGEVGDAIAAAMDIGANQFCNGQTLEDCAGIQLFPDVLPISRLHQFTEQSLNEIFNHNTMFNNYLSSQVLRLCVFSQVHYMRLEKFTEYSLKRQEMISLCYRSMQRTLGTFNENHLESTNFPKSWILRNPYNTESAKKALQKGLIDFEALKKVYEDENNQLQLNSKVKMDSLLNDAKKQEYDLKQAKINEIILKKQKDIFRKKAISIDEKLTLQKIKERQKIEALDPGYMDDNREIVRKKMASREELRRRGKIWKEKKLKKEQQYADDDSDMQSRVQTRSKRSQSMQSRRSQSMNSRTVKFDLPPQKRSSRNPKRKKSAFSVVFPNFLDMHDEGYSPDSAGDFEDYHEDTPSTAQSGHTSDDHSGVIIPQPLDLNEYAQRQQSTVIETQLKNAQKGVSWHFGVDFEASKHNKGKKKLKSHSKQDTVIDSNFFDRMAQEFINDQNDREEYAQQQLSDDSEPQDPNPSAESDQQLYKRYKNKGKFQFYTLRNAIEHLRKIPNTKLIFKDGKIHRVSKSTPTPQRAKEIDTDPSAPDHEDQGKPIQNKKILTTDNKSAINQKFPNYADQTAILDLDDESMDDKQRVDSLVKQVVEYYQKQDKRHVKNGDKGQDQYIIVPQPINDYRPAENQDTNQQFENSVLQPQDAQLINRSDVMMEMLNDSRAIQMFNIELENGVFQPDQDEDHFSIDDQYNATYIGLGQKQEKRIVDKLNKEQVFLQKDPGMVQAMYNVARQGEYAENINSLLEFIAEYSDYEECMENVNNPEFFLSQSLNRNPFNSWLLRKNGVIYQVYDEMFFVPDNYEMTHRPMKEWMFFPFSALCNGMLNHSFVTLGSIQQVSRPIAPNFEALNFRARIEDAFNDKKDIGHDYTLLPRKMEFRNGKIHGRQKSVFLNDLQFAPENVGYQQLQRIIPKESDSSVQSYHPNVSVHSLPTPKTIRPLTVQESPHSSSVPTTTPDVTINRSQLVRTKVSKIPKTQTQSHTSTESFVDIVGTKTPSKSLPSIHGSIPSNPLQNRSRISATVRIPQTTSSSDLANQSTSLPDTDTDLDIVTTAPLVESKLSKSRDSVKLGIKSVRFLDGNVPNSIEEANLMFDEHAHQRRPIKARLDPSLHSDIFDNESNDSGNPFIRTMIEPRYTTGRCQFLSDFECASLYFNKLKELSKGKDLNIRNWAKERIKNLQENLTIGNCDSIAESAFENFGLMLTRIAEHAQNYSCNDELVINEPFVLDTIVKLLPRAIDAFYERHCISITMSKMEGILDKKKPGFNRLKQSPFRKIGRTLLYLPQGDSQIAEDLQKQLTKRVIGTDLQVYEKYLKGLKPSSLLDSAGLEKNQDNIIIFNHFFPDFTVRAFMNSAIVYYQEMMKYFFTNMNIGDLEDGAQE